MTAATEMQSSVPLGALASQLYNVHCGDEVGKASFQNAVHGMPFLCFPRIISRRNRRHFETRPTRKKTLAPSSRCCPSASRRSFPRSPTPPPLPPIALTYSHCIVNINALSPSSVIAKAPLKRLAKADN